MMIVQWWLSVWPLQSMLPSSCAANWAMLKVERLLDQWCNLWKICVQLVLHFSYLLATQSVIGRTSQPTNSASQQTPKLDVVCVSSRHRHWLSAVCGCQPSVTKLSSRRPRIWNSLPQHVTSAPSLAIFCSRLKTDLFRRCFPWLHHSLVVPEKWHVITDTLIVFVTYLLTYLLTLYVASLSKTDC